ncbi:MAG: GGDEF domain-containing protein [Actinomycetota bacterium]
MVRDPIWVLVVGTDEDLHEELLSEEGFTVDRAERLDGDTRTADVDAVVLSLSGVAPLEALAALRVQAPAAAVVVITEPGNVADGTVALHAGADDHLVRGSIPVGMLPRAVRYAVTVRRLRRELSTQDDETGLLNLRGFAPIAEHHLRMADRAHTPVVFLFVRLDELAGIVSDGAEEAASLARDAAAVLLEAVRDSDVPARITIDTFCVLLTGDARGAEALVLSRLVEAIAVHDARLDQPRSLSLSVGSALYDPDHPGTLEQILSTADRRLAAQADLERSEQP